MKRPNPQIWMGFTLVLLSIFFYLVQYWIFRDVRTILGHLLDDIAFVFVQVLLVSMIINRLISLREKRTRLQKMNTVIEVFFSETGTDLLTRICGLDPDADLIRGHLIVTGDWSDREFARAGASLSCFQYRVNARSSDFTGLRRVLLAKREFLVRLMDNPNLLEHESFTELLQAIFHLTEELSRRENMNRLPAADLEHLNGDARRVYLLLIRQWLDYIKYLKDHYPYLFSFAIRTNPFDQKASVVIQ
jgi:hypothetical protein